MWGSVAAHTEKKGVRRMSKLSIFCLAVGVLLSASAETITCAEAGPQHLQGVSADGANVYWSFTSRLVKTDAVGGVQCSADVPNHSGDLCAHNGEVYVATREGSRNDIVVYDAQTLARKRRYSLAVDCTGGLEVAGIEYADGRFWVAIGHQPDAEQTVSRVFEYTPSFVLVAKHELPAATAYGVQTIAWSDGQFVLGVYGPNASDASVVPAGALLCGPNLSGCAYSALAASEGVMTLGGKLFTAVSKKNALGLWEATATCHEAAAGYVSGGASGAVCTTPSVLRDFGFPTTSWYFGEADQLVATVLDGDRGLIANAGAARGGVITLGSAANTFCGAVAIPSGTLVVPSVGSIGGSSAVGLAKTADEPFVLSGGTVRFTGGGTLDRKFVLYPLAGMERRSAVVDVTAGNDVRVTGSFANPRNCGNLLKTGAGTFTLATSATAENWIGSAGSHGEVEAKSVLDLAANGDGPQVGNPAFGVADGRFVLDTAPGVTTHFGDMACIGLQSTTQAVAETTGRFDLINGIADFQGWLFVGRYNGTQVTAPDSLAPAVTVSGGELRCVNLGMGYGTGGFAPFTAHPELTVHGGAVYVSNALRLDHTQSWARVTVDGGLLSCKRLDNANYQAGSHLEMEVSGTGRAQFAVSFGAANVSSTQARSQARVVVRDGGTFGTRALTAAADSDVEFSFDGGTYVCLQSGNADEIPSTVDFFVGSKGMTVDITEASGSGPAWKAPIRAASGVADGGLTILNTDANAHALRLMSDIVLAGGVVGRKATLLLGTDLSTPLTLVGEKCAVRAIADVTVDSLSMADCSDCRIDCGLTGPADTPGVRSYLLVARAFTSPKGSIAVNCYDRDTQTLSVPYGTYPFLKVPAAADISAGSFVSAMENDASHVYRFVQSETDGWRTISLVIEAADTREKVDPRTGDWLSGSGKAWTLGPWLVDFAGTGVTCANAFFADKTNRQAGGLNVSGDLTLSAGGTVMDGCFAKFGIGSLTLGGTVSYLFAKSNFGVSPAADTTEFDLFDASGNSKNNHSAAVVVGAGTLVVGTGSDNPTVRVQGGYDVWVGSATTTAEGGERDARLLMRSGTFEVRSGSFVVGRNHGTETTSANAPLKAVLEQDGGDMVSYSTIVGYSNNGLSHQEDSLVIDGGRFTTDYWLRLGMYSSSRMPCSSKLVVNGGVLEVGAQAYGKSNEGALTLGYNKGHDVLFEQNGGEVRLWKGLSCKANTSGHLTTVNLNGGVLTYGSGTFTGDSYSTLNWNGTVVKPYHPDYSESLDNAFNWFTARNVLANGAIIDLSEANVDYLPLNYDFAGSGPFVVRGGDTNRCVTINYAFAHTGQLVAEKGGVLQIWGDHASNRRVFVKDGGGYANYYSSTTKELHLGEQATDATFLFGYGYPNCVNWHEVTETLSIAGTVYHCWRRRGEHNPLRMPPAGTYVVLKAPKGSFAGVDVATQFKPHPALVRPDVTYTYSLDTSDANVDTVKLTLTGSSVVSETMLDVHAYPHELSIGPRTVKGTLELASQSAKLTDVPTSGGGTVKVVAPLSGDGTIKMTTGRIEGRPEYFDGLTLDLNNASVRFTESGSTTARLQNSNGGATGLGLAVPAGKTVYVRGDVIDNPSCLLKMEPGTLVLQGSAETRRLADSDKNAGASPFSIPENGDVPSSPSLGVLAGKLVLDLPGTLAFGSGSLIWIGSHHVPDGTGGAYPTILEQWQGNLVGPSTELFAIGRHVDNNWDSYWKYTRRPYAAYNLCGGTNSVCGIIVGYSNGKLCSWSRNELNVYGGRLEVGAKRFAVPHEGSNVMIDDEYDEASVNVYGGEIVKESGEAIQLGSYYGTTCTYPGRGSLNVYGGAVLCGAGVDINVPNSSYAIGRVNLNGGVLQARNVVRAAKGDTTEGHVRFDGGTFRPLQSGAWLCDFDDVKVGVHGATVEMVDGNFYTIGQPVESDVADAAARDGGVKVTGCGTLRLSATCAFTGPVGAVGREALLKQGVSGAFSSSAVLKDGGALDLGGYATTFEAVSGAGLVTNGSVRVTGRISPPEAGGGELAFDNLTVAAGATFCAKVSDDGATAGLLRVKGALVFERPVTVDFCREDDAMVPPEFEVTIAEADSISFKGGAVVRLPTGRRTFSSLGVVNGTTLKCKMTKSGCLLFLR